MKKIFEKAKHPSIWVMTTYFAEGFPFTMTRTVVSVFLRDMKVSLESIGLTSLYGLPWILKFLWSPQVDGYATKRKWMLVTQFMISVLMFIAAVLAPFSSGVVAISVMFFVVAIFAATQDITIDGYYMEALDKDGQAQYLGYRVLAYRIAMMTASGAIVTVGAATRWYWGFAMAGAIMALLFLYHAFFLDDPEMPKKLFRELFINLLKMKNFIIVTLVCLTVMGFRSFLDSQYYGSLKSNYPILKKMFFGHWVGLFLLIALILVSLLRKTIKKRLMKDPDSNYTQSFVTFVDRQKIGIILFFVIMFRAGEWMTSTMSAPFIVDLGIKIHYGWLTSLVALPASIIGALLGGMGIKKYSLKRVIWPFLLLQNFTLLFYFFISVYFSSYVKLNTGVDNPTSIGTFNIALVAITIFFEQFGGGLGTAVLMTYLMRLCLPQFKASHYAISSSLMSLGGMFAGIASGIIAGSIGYSWAFGLSFLVSIPAMLVIPFLPLVDIGKKG